MIFCERTVPMPGRDASKARTGILPIPSELSASTSARDSVPCFSASLAVARSWRAAAALASAARLCSVVNGGRVMALCSSSRSCEL
jgi:hypothetical protein